MLTTTKVAYATFLVCAVCIGLLIGIGMTAHAQNSKPPSWTVAGSELWEIKVVDLAGVCLYQSTSKIAGYSYGNAVALVAVPKTLLPIGAGCQ